MTQTLKPGRPAAQSDPMSVALAEAAAGSAAGEVPVGAVLIDPATGAILARAHNLTETTFDPTAHAEILVLRAACRDAGSPRLPHADLYVTLEPCALCAAAIAAARIRRVYFGAWDPKGGAIDHGPRLYALPGALHRPETYGGLRESEASALLRGFFAARR